MQLAVLSNQPDTLFPAPPASYVSDRALCSRVLLVCGRVGTAERHTLLTSCGRPVLERLRPGLSPATYQSPPALPVHSHKHSAQKGSPHECVRACVCLLLCVCDPCSAVKSARDMQNLCINRAFYPVRDRSLTGQPVYCAETLLMLCSYFRVSWYLPSRDSSAMPGSAHRHPEVHQAFFFFFAFFQKRPTARGLKTSSHQDSGGGGVRGLGGECLFSCSNDRET